MAKGLPEEREKFIREALPWASRARLRSYLRYLRMTTHRRVKGLIWAELQRRKRRG